MKVTYTEEAVADIVEAIAYHRHPDELLIVRVYHQRRQPLTR